MSLDRRNFLRRATGLAALSVIPVPLIGLTSCSVRRDVRRAGPGEGGHGELTPSQDCPELALPPDFNVVRLSRTGERMSDAVSTPGDFDGMAAFPLPNGHVRLVRNHEISARRLLGDAAKAYDAIGGGGTTSLEVRVTRDGAGMNPRPIETLRSAGAGRLGIVAYAFCRRRSRHSSRTRSTGGSARSGRPRGDRPGPSRRVVIK